MKVLRVSHLRDFLRSITIFDHLEDKLELEARENNEKQTKSTKEKFAVLLKRHSRSSPPRTRDRQKKHNNYIYNALQYQNITDPAFNNKENFIENMPIRSSTLGGHNRSVHLNNEMIKAKQKTSTVSRSNTIPYCQA